MDTLPNGVLLDSLGRMIGRTALPIFVFLVTEGYIHTRSRGRYLLRLLIFAFLSAYPFKALFYPYDSKIHCDTLFTLSLGLIAVWVIDTVFLRYLGLESRRGARAQGQTGGRTSRETRVPVDGAAGTATETAAQEMYMASPAAGDPPVIRVVQIVVRLVIAICVTALCCVIATRIGADYRYGGVLLVVVFYLFRGLRIAGVLIGYTWISWYNVNEVYSFAGMALVQLYNGQRGRQHKYLFYLFYPGHLLLLLILRRMTLGF